MASYYDGVRKELLSDDLKGLANVYGEGGKGGGGKPDGGGGGNGGGKGRNRFLSDDYEWSLSVTTIDDLAADFMVASSSEINAGEIATSTQAVPEPSTLVLAAMALLGLAGWTWRKRQS